MNHPKLSRRVIFLIKLQLSYRKREPMSMPRLLAIASKIKGFGAPFASRPPAATLPGLAWTNLPEFPSVSSGFHPAQALGVSPLLRPCFSQGAHSALPRGPPCPQAKIGSEAMEVSARLRISSIDV